MLAQENTLDAPDQISTQRMGSCYAEWCLWPPSVDEIVHAREAWPTKLVIVGDFLPPGDRPVRGVSPNFLPPGDLLPGTFCDDSCMKMMKSRRAQGVPGACPEMGKKLDIR